MQAISCHDIFVNKLKSLRLAVLKYLLIDLTDYDVRPVALLSRTVEEVKLHHYCGERVNLCRHKCS